MLAWIQVTRIPNALIISSTTNRPSHDTFSSPFLGYGYMHHLALRVIPYGMKTHKKNTCFLFFHAPTMLFHIRTKFGHHLEEL